MIDNSTKRVDFQMFPEARIPIYFPRNLQKKILQIYLEVYFQSVHFQGFLRLLKFP